jgi:hypothetical protein
MRNWPPREKSPGLDRRRTSSSLADRDSQTKRADIYENIVIGNFLFGLGAAMGWRHREAPVPPTAVSLLQQTPRDKTLGDLLVENTRLIRLIEFKRKTNLRGLEKEKAKRNQLAKALESDTWRNLQPISRNVHWFVESNFPMEWYRIVPYLDFADRGVTRQFENLAEFVEAIAIEAFENLTNDERAAQEISDAHNYLSCLESVWRGKRSASSSGTLCLQFTAKGNLQYVTLKHFRELSHKLERVLQDRKHDLEPELGYPLKRDGKHDREPDLGHRLERKRGYEHER